MILITGVNGLVGSALVRELLAQGRVPTGVGQGEQRNHALGAFAYRALDLASPAALAEVLDAVKPTVIFHCAAMTAVDRCESEGALAWATNVAPTLQLAAWSALHGARFVYVSTDYVFSGEAGPYQESDGMGPLSVYAKTKAAGELAALSVNAASVIARTSIPFGTLAHVKKDFVRWLVAELEAMRSVKIVTDQLSCPTLVDDLARSLILLADGDFTGVVHTAGRTGLSRFDFAQLIARVWSLDSSLISPAVTADLRQPAPRPMDARLDVSLALSLGLPLHELEEGLRTVRNQLKGK